MATLMRKRRSQDLLIFLVFIGLVTALGSNVCTNERIVPSTQHHSIDELVSACQNLGLTDVVCEAARSGEVSFNDLYVLVNATKCCDGWIDIDESCSNACPDGKYGENCSLSCKCFNKAGCDHVTGECRCPDEWTGQKCQERCQPGFYGQNCTLSCTDQCQNNGICQPSSGQCLCDYNWEGDDCSVMCSGLRCAIRSGKCANRATYDPIGICLCAPGWTGRYCTEPCTTSMYGSRCESTCQCQNGGWCNWKDGSCLCLRGYSGTFCTDSCNEGLYGQDCVLRCNCPWDGACDPENGNCLYCPLGYTGPRCTKPCLLGSWGKSCRNVCECSPSSDCDRFTGKCEDNVTTETSGDLTSTLRPSNRYQSPITAIVGSVGGVIAVILAMFLLGILYGRKRKSHRVIIENPPLNHQNPTMPHSAQGEPCDADTFCSLDSFSSEELSAGVENPANRGGLDEHVYDDVADEVHGADEPYYDTPL